MFMQRGMSAYVCDELSIGFPLDSSKPDTSFVGNALWLSNYDTVHMNEEWSTAC